MATLKNKRNPGGGEEGGGTTSCQRQISGDQGYSLLGATVCSPDVEPLGQKQGRFTGSLKATPNHSTPAAHGNGLGRKSRGASVKDDAGI